MPIQRYATLVVRFDAQHQNLRFNSIGDAKRFQDFVKLFNLESGLDMADGTYHLIGDPILWTFFKPKNKTNQLHIRRLEWMMRAVVRARLAEEPNLMPKVYVGLERDSLTFNYDPLPPRQRPRTGDLFRVVDEHAPEHAWDTIVGRVLHDYGDTLEVFSLTDDRDGRPSIDARRNRIPARCVMKYYGLSSDTFRQAS
jgi:hypothetical protein